MAIRSTTNPKTIRKKLAIRAEPAKAACAP